MAHNYQKIYAPFGRKSPNDRMVDTNIYSRNWVQTFYENDIKMWASEKIDGTSVGIVWDGERILFIGHTDKSIFNPRYLEYLNKRFNTPEFESCIEEIFGDKKVTLYGEGISKDYNVDYGYPEGNFILYDIQKEDGKFYNRDFVKEVGDKLNIQYPEEFLMTMAEAIHQVKSRPESFLNENYKLEGLVLRAPIELYTNSNERIICKIKVKDFVDCKDYKNV